MSRTVVKAWSGLFAVVFVLVQALGCLPTPTNSQSSAQTTVVEEPTFTEPPPTTTPAEPTFIPPPVEVTTSATPTITMPPLPTTTTLPPTDTTSEPTSATPVPVPTPDPLVPPEGAKKLVIQDPRGDLLDGQGQPIQAEPYLDIVGAEVYVSETSLFFRMVLDDVMPLEYGSPGLMLEWDFFIDTKTATGNDIDPNYLLRLVMMTGLVRAELRSLVTDEYWPVEFQIVDSTVDFSVDASLLAIDKFNFTVATYKWLADSRMLLVTDRAPNQGHYNMPNGHVYIKPGLPAVKLDLEIKINNTTVAVWYNEGNEVRAKWCAEAVKEAQADISRLMKPSPPLNALPSALVVFVYASQSELVAGLQEYSSFTRDEALRYQNGGAPRPTNGFIHIPPDYDLRAVYHQQVLGAMDRLC